MIGDAAQLLLGPELTGDTGDGFAWTEHVLGAPGFRIAGGSDEIQRTIIGERVLGLPAEPRPPANPAATPPVDLTSEGSR
jgi:alkylation response protein AidB-like acyl-CoA dehydrogenase